MIKKSNYKNISENMMELEMGEPISLKILKLHTNKLQNAGIPKLKLAKQNINSTDLSDTDCESRTSFSSSSHDFSNDLKFIKEIKENTNIYCKISKKIDPSINFEIKSEKEIDKGKIVIKSNFKIQKKYKNIIFNPYASNDDFDNHLLRIFSGFNQILDKPTSLEIEMHQTNLNFSNKNKKVLFFELENTLIARCFQKKKYDFSIDFKTCNNQIIQLYYKKRPYYQESMEKLSQIYDIYIFTSASKNVAEQILNYIDPKKSYFLGVLSKEECLISEKGRVIKDLRIINNKDLKDLILIDHAPFFSITTQIDNEIPLLFWDGNSDDCELKYLTKYLKKIRDSIDVREENRKLLKLSELLRECSNKF